MKKLATRFARARDDTMKDAPLESEGKLMVHKQTLLKKKKKGNWDESSRNPRQQANLSADEDLANTPPGLDEAGPKKRTKP